MQDLCVVIPVYNEGRVVRNVVEKVLVRGPHVVCVDDGSTDDSYEQCRRTSASVLRHPFNLGQGAAIQTGIEHGLFRTSCPYFATFDADGQHDIADIARMLEVVKERELDIVLGSRFLGQGSIQEIPWLRRLVLRVGVQFTRMETGLRVTDAHNGLRVFTRKVARQLDITEPGMTHASEIARRVAQEGFLYQELPVTVHYSEYSRSKGQSLLNAINIGTDLIFRIGGRKR